MTRFLVIGLARAGTAMALALAKKGERVHVVDQKAADQLDMLQQMDRLEALGVDVTTSWSGEVDWGETDVIAPSPGVPLRHPALQEAVKRGVPVWSEIEVAYRISPAPILAITGTNGKSTVTALTWHVLSGCGFRAVLCGNIAGTGLNEVPITTAALEADDDSVLVAEVSSYQLEWIESFRPHVATVLNISQDHATRHGSVEAYARTKLRIYENQRETDFAIINRDNPETMPQHLAARMLAFHGDDPDLIVTDGQISSDGAVLRVDELWLPGKHNVDNAATAWLFANALGADSREVCRHIKTFKGIDNRMELVASVNGIRFINNSMCTNPEALRTSVDAAPPSLLLLAGGQSDVQDYSPLDRVDVAKVRKAFLFGPDAGHLQRFFGAAPTYTKMADAFAAAAQEAEPGDTVLLAPGCKSFDEFPNFEARGETFRALVREYVGNAG